jgi:hypothetical protein
MVPQKRVPDAVMLIFWPTDQHLQLLKRGGRCSTTPPDGLEMMSIDGAGDRQAISEPGSRWRLDARWPGVNLLEHESVHTCSEDQQVTVTPRAVHSSDIAVSSCRPCANTPENGSWARGSERRDGSLLRNASGRGQTTGARC